MLLNVEFPGPILIFDESRMAEACNDIYAMGYYPMVIIKDRKNEIFREAIANYPQENIDCIIIPCRYLTTFLT